MESLKATLQERHTALTEVLQADWRVQREALESQLTQLSAALAAAQTDATERLQQLASEASGRATAQAAAAAATHDLLVAQASTSDKIAAAVAAANAEHKEALAALTTALTASQTKVAALVASEASLQAAVQSARDDAAAAQAALVKASAALADSEARTAAAVDEAARARVTCAADVEAVQGKLRAVEGKLAETTRELAASLTEVARLTAVLAERGSGSQALEAAVGSLGTALKNDMSVIGAQVTAAVDRVERMSGDVARQATVLDTLVASHRAATEKSVVLEGMLRDAVGEHGVGAIKDTCDLLTQRLERVQDTVLPEVVGVVQKTLQQVLSSTEELSRVKVSMEGVSSVVEASSQRVSRRTVCTVITCGTAGRGGAACFGRDLQGLCHRRSRRT